MNTTIDSGEIRKYRNAFYGLPASYRTFVLGSIKGRVNDSHTDIVNVWKSLDRCRKQREKAALK